MFTKETKPHQIDDETANADDDKLCIIIFYVDLLRVIESVNTFQKEVVANRYQEQTVYQC